LVSRKLGEEYMAAITLLKLTDTFNTLLTRLNEIVTKVNKVNVEESKITINFSTSSSTEPQTGDITVNTGTLYFDNTGALKFKYKIGETVTTKTITVT
jgi:hypothetical protein|tara:strand:+ start:170 stop:463 length:294 start_codon:yes stop_codon:yes gene_type:complete